MIKYFFILTVLLIVSSCGQNSPKSETIRSFINCRQDFSKNAQLDEIATRANEIRIQCKLTEEEVLAIFLKT